MSVREKIRDGLDLVILATVTLLLLAFPVGLGTVLVYFAAASLASGASGWALLLAAGAIVMGLVFLGGAVVVAPGMVRAVAARPPLAVGIRRIHDAFSEIFSGD